MFFLLAAGFGYSSVALAQWEIENSHTSASLRGIDNAGGGAVWASGSEGTVLRSVDNGHLWQTCAVPSGAEELDFRGIQAFDKDTAIVMSSGTGGQSRLYKTTDGCKTWKLIFTNPDKDGFWDAINFYSGSGANPVASRSNAMLIGDPVDGAFAIFFTQDGGDTWHRWGENSGTRRAKVNTHETLFAASNTSIVSTGINNEYCFVTGGKGGPRLLFEQAHSPFDGESWSAFSNVNLPLPSADSAGAFSIGRRAEGDGKISRYVIVGGDYLKPEKGAAATAYQPTFLFRIAASAAKTPPHGYRSAVAYDSTQKLWITVGPNGTDISTDDGKNWRPLKPGADDAPDADKNWNALSLPFVVGPHGRIGRLRAIPAP